MNTGTRFIERRLRRDFVTGRDQIMEDHDFSMNDTVVSMVIMTSGLRYKIIIRRNQAGYLFESIYMVPRTGMPVLLREKALTEEEGRLSGISRFSLYIAGLSDGDDLQ